MAIIPLKILAIDGDPAALFTLEAALREAMPQAAVLTAPDGPQGIALAQAEDPDVILLDMAGPGLDSNAVCRGLKADDRTRHVPVICLIAAHADRESRLRALEAGAEAFLTQPPDAVELIAQIRAMARIKAGHVQARQEHQRLTALVAERTAALERELAERKRREEALRETERRLAAIIDAAPFGAHSYELLPDGRLRFCGYNQAANKILDIDHALLIGKTIEEAFPGLVGTSIPAVYRQVAILGDAYSDEQVAYHEGQIVGVYEIHAFQTTANRMTVFFRDITERRRAEEALRESEERLSLFVAHSPIHAYIKQVTPHESRVLKASDNYREMVGVSGAEMVGKTMADLFPAEFAAKITADDWAVVSEGKILKLDEELNGRHYTTIKFPIQQGGQYLLAGYTIDVTDRQQAEAQLTEQLGELRRWQDVMLDREDRVQELKREVNALDRRLGEPVRYPSVADL